MEEELQAFLSLIRYLCSFHKTKWEMIDEDKMPAYKPAKALTRMALATEDVESEGIRAVLYPARGRKKRGKKTILDLMQTKTAREAIWNRPSFQLCKDAILINPSNQLRDPNPGRKGTLNGPFLTWNPDKQPLSLEIRSLFERWTIHGFESVATPGTPDTIRVLAKGHRRTEMIPDRFLLDQVNWDPRTGDCIKSKQIYVLMACLTGGKLVDLVIRDDSTRWGLGAWGRFVPNEPLFLIFFPMDPEEVKKKLESKKTAMEEA